MKKWLLLLLVLLIFFGAATLFASPAQQSDCPPTRLIVGGRGQVTPGSANRIRNAASTSGDQIGQIPAGGIFTVLEGPVCADGFNWWRVDYEGVVGWTVEGNNDGFFVEPIGLPPTSVPGATATHTAVPSSSEGACPAGDAPEPQLVVGMWARLTSNIPSRLRRDPGTGGEEIAQIQPIDIVTVVDGPRCVDGFNWFRVDLNGLVGWTAEGSGSDYFIEVVPATATPTPSRTPTITWTPTPTRTPTITFTPSITNTPTITPTFTPVPLNNPRSVSWSADGRWLAVGTADGVYLYDTSDYELPPRKLPGVDTEIRKVAFSPVENNLLAFGSWGGVSFVIWDIETDEVVFRSVYTSENINTLMFTADGSRVLVSTPTGFGLVVLETGVPALPIRLLSSAFPDEDIRETAISADGRYLAVGTHQGRAYLYNLESTSTEPVRLNREIRTEPIFAVAFSPDRSQVIIGDSAGSLQMWAFQTSTQDRSASFIRGEGFSISNQVNVIAFHPDGTVLATGESDPQGVVRVFNAQTLERVEGFGLTTTDPNVYDVVYSPDGKYLAVVMDTRVWILETEGYSEVAALMLRR